MSEQILPIKVLREKLGMTQTDLAHAAGLTPAAISQFESGIRRPSFQTIERLSDAPKGNNRLFTWEKENVDMGIY